MFTQKNIIIFIVSLIVVGGLGYYLGTKQTNSPSARETNGQFTGNRGNFNRGQNGQFTGRGGMVVGEIINFNDQTLTIKNETDGGSRLIFLSTSTTITKTEPATTNDLQAGKKVMVSGSQTTDGSVKAQMIQLRNQ